MNKLKKIPKFNTEEEEKKFWQEHDSTEYLDWSKAKLARFPNLKASTRTISLRLPETLFNELKIFANKEDVPYQSLMKIILAEGLAKLKHRIILRHQHK
jgi:predicted DNA binding CopG/RHH family protein